MHVNDPPHLPALCQYATGKSLLLSVASTWTSPAHVQGSSESLCRHEWSPGLLTQAWAPHPLIPQAQLLMEHQIRKSTTSSRAGIGGNP